jgi:hypothetical protein
MGWRPVLDWAESNGVLDAVSLIVDAGYLADFASSNLIHFLDFIHHYQIRKCLQAWRLVDPAADLLARLVQAVDRDASIYEKTPHPSKGHAKDQVRGHTSKLYLLGMVIAETPLIYTPDEVADFLTLKLWTLIQLLNQAAEGIFQEAYRVELAQRLRQCEDSTHEFASEVIHDVLPTTDDYTLVPYLLGQKAEKLRIKRLKDNVTTGSGFLRVVMEIAANHEGKKGAGPYGKGSEGWFKRLGGNLEDFKPVIVFPELPILPEDESEVSYLPSDDEADVLALDFGDVKKSLAELENQQKDLLSEDVEQQQYLNWSWRNLNPVEISALDNWIDMNLQAAGFLHRLLGAQVWIGRHCGRSLKQVMEMGIGQLPRTEWQWHQERGYLHRLPPKRHNAWAPEAHHFQWINPITEQIECKLPERITSILSEAFRRHPDALSLGDLWESGMDPNALFRKLTQTSALKRIQAGMLANVLPVEAFQTTGNAIYTRLLSAHGNKGLPGACAYPSFLGSDVQAFVSTDNLTDIAMGSRLDPLDCLLIPRIAEATRLLDEARQGDDLIQYHNHLAVYLREALLAATGIRPVRDVLESPCQIDAEEHFIFIDDKASRNASQGRLVPLPASLATYLRQGYARYLKLLSNALFPVAPILAGEINRMAGGIPSDKIPYLFLLTTAANKLGWENVSTEKCSELGSFDWPLPANLWRHRLPDRLRREGISQEIIDGMLGHLAHNTGSYGPYSPRFWADDRKKVQPILEVAFAVLGFQLPRIGRNLPPFPQQESILYEKPLQANAFGKKARLRTRRRINQRAFREAEALIKQQLEGRDLTELDEAELQALARNLCLQMDGKPHPNGLQRYAHFVRRVDAAWRKKGKRVRIGGRVYSGGYQEKSQFLPEAVGALPLHQQLVKGFETLPRKVLATSRSYNKDAALMASLSLCLEHRISNPNLLLGIIEKRDFRLVIAEQCAYLEYAPQLSPQLTRAAVQRFPIKADTAQWLDAALAQKQPYKLDKPTPTYLNTLLKSMQTSWHLRKEKPTLRQFIRALARTVDQSNLLTLSAIDTAVLSGTLPSYSLTWEDRLRLEKGQPVSITYEEIAQPDTGEDDLLPLYSLSPTEEQDLLAYETNAKRFLGELRHLIPPSTEESKWSTREKRQKLARQVRKSLQPHAGQVSSTILLLGHWIIFLLTQRITGKREFLRFNSIRRYLTSLSKPFTQLGYAFDLANADSAAITDFYRRILKLGKLRAQAYRARRIVSFQRWARGQGLEDPNWSELPNLPSIPEVSPGIVTEQEYLSVFQQLQAQANIPHRLMDIQAFVWLCVYRYGLRESEALYLRATDWMKDANGDIILFVRRNPQRRLKVDRSRRQVPCVQALIDEEQALLERVLVGNKRHHDWETAPYVIEEQWRQSSWQIFTGIAVLLKSMTGNPHLVIHHGRHAAGNHVGIALYQPGLPHYWQAFTKDADRLQRTRQILLGHMEVTRRSSFAGCRYLGHGTPKTTTENYWHFLVDAVTESLAINNQVRPDDQWKQTILLKEYTHEIEPVVPATVSYRERPLVPERLIDMLQYLADGRTPERTANILHIDPKRCQHINGLFQQLGLKMLRGIHSKYDEEANWSAHSFPHEGFLRHITLGGWRRLVALCMNHPLQSKTEPYPDTDELDRMIGASRHLLMWQEKHFEWVSAFLGHYGIEASHYQLVIRTGSNLKIRQWAEQKGSVVLSQKAAAGAKAKVPMQLDTLRVGNGRVSLDEDRCALVFKRNAKSAVRNGYELAVLFLAWMLGERGSN